MNDVLNMKDLLHLLKLFFGVGKREMLFWKSYALIHLIPESFLSHIFYLFFFIYILISKRRSKDEKKKSEMKYTKGNIFRSVFSFWNLIYFLIAYTYLNSERKDKKEKEEIHYFFGRVMNI